MKRFRSSAIIVLLMPVLLLQLLYPRFNQNRLFDLLARQPVMVCSFVWIPLLEISVLVNEWIMPCPTITPLETSKNSSKQQPPATASSDAFLAIAASAGLFFAALKKLILAALELCFGSGDTCEERSPALSLIPLLTPLPLYILRSSPALPRGDPPSALTVC